MNTTQKLRLTLLGILLTGAAESMGATAGEENHWLQTDSTLALQRGDQTLWQFNYGPEHPKPCFHPVALPGSQDLTWFRPDDHPWHRALWFSWKFINDINYWEEDRATGASAGRTETVKTTVDPQDDHSARIVQQLRYRPIDGDPVLKEDRVIEVSAPARDGTLVMDWTMRFSALTEVVLDRTPLPDEPDGKVFGGYAGLSVRLPRELHEVAVVTTEGPVSFRDDRFRGRSVALDYQGLLDGRAQGIAIVDHPKNLNTPSPWYAINGPVMRYFSPAVICYGPHTMEAGDSFTLRYRVIVHPERWDGERLSREARRFKEDR
jgi:hypothetical protein